MADGCVLLCACCALPCSAGTLRPTLFCAVPRVFDRIYSGVMQKVSLLQSCLPPCSLVACPLSLAELVPAAGHAWVHSLALAAPPGLR